MQGLTVLTTLQYQGAHWDTLVQALGGAEVLRFDSPQCEGFDDALAKADVALLAKDPDVRILSAPKLKWIHIDHAGLNRAAKPEAFRDGLVVTGSAGRSSPHPKPACSQHCSSAPPPRGHCLKAALTP